MKVRVEATKLTKPQVSFISLVERGANRLPFRILKSLNPENGMSLDLDLTKVFKRTKEAPKPTLLGVVIEKTDDLDQFKQVLSDSGLSVDKLEEADKTVIFRQADGNVEDATVIKLSDTSLALVAGGNKREDPVMPLDSLFSDALEAVQKALGEEDRSGIDAALDQLKQDVALYAVLPSKVFAADSALAQKAESIAEAKKEAVETETPPTDTPSDPPKVEKEEQPPVTPEAEKQPDITAMIASAVADGLKSIESAIAKSVAPVQEAISSLQERVNAVDGSVKGLDKKISEVETVAKAAEASIKKTVVSSPPAGDPTPAKPVRKQDDDPRTGIFDTAFIQKKASGVKAQRR